jgi:hypothetical protein
VENVSEEKPRRYFHTLKEAQEEAIRLNTLMKEKKLAYAVERDVHGYYLVEFSTEPSEEEKKVIEAYKKKWYPEETKPTLKELFKGTTLDGYIEAARSKPLTTWFPPQVEVEKIEAKPKTVRWHGTDYYAYGSSARPLDWLTIKSAITSVAHTALVRLSRTVDYSSDVPYFDILLSPTPLLESEVKALELEPIKQEDMIKWGLR